MTAARRRPGWADPWLWTVAGAAARHAVGAWRLRQSLAFLDASRRSLPADGPSSASAPVLHLVIPVLWEQQHVAGAVRWFADLAQQIPGCTVTFVSTAREEHERQLLIGRLTGLTAAAVTARRFPQLTPDDVDQLSNLARLQPLTEADARTVLGGRRLTGDVLDTVLAARPPAGVVRHVRYPGSGRKAAQINHAVAGLSEKDPGLAYVVVYDVDSRPDVAMLRCTIEHLLHRKQTTGRLPLVVQQSARFHTAGSARRGWERSICRGSATVQTLWTLRREIPSFRRFAYAGAHATGLSAVDAARRGLVQTVGHGLLVRLDLFRDLEGMPEYTTLDDLPFGYALTLRGIPVDVLPVLLDAPAPEHAAELVTTLRRWWSSYLDYPACAKAAYRNGVGDRAEHAAALATAGYRAAAWLAAGPATAICAVAVLRPSSRPLVRLLGAAALWLGCVTPVRMSAAAEPLTPGPASQAQQAVEVFAAYLVRGLGPATAVGSAVTRHLRGRITAGLDLSPKTYHRSSPREES